MSFSSEKRAAWARWDLPVVAVLLVVVSWPVAVVGMEESPSFRVRYRSADAVYLEAGERAGLRVGDRLEVKRADAVVAVIEIVFTAQHSSSAKLVEERSEIRVGDLAHPLGALRPPPTEPAPRVDAVVERAPRERIPAVRSPRPPRANLITGTFELGFERFFDDGIGGRGVDRTTGRLSLRGRNLGDLPLDLRLRVRSRRVERDRPFDGGAPASEDRDRVYELALQWRPLSSRFRFELGRLNAGAFSGIGFLDGASGSVDVRPGWRVGAFFGRRPELADLGFDSSGTRFGAFSHWEPATSGRWEVFVAGVDEDSDTGITRQLAVLETRLGFGAGRWSLYQRLEYVLSRDGDTASSLDDEGISQLALVLTGQLGARGRLTVSYDQNDPLLVLDDDLGRVARFVGLRREGLRARLRFGRANGVGVSVFAGVRDGEGADDDTTYSFGLGASRARVRGFSFGGDVVGFSNPLTEGRFATVNGRYGFEGGHFLEFILGATSFDEDLGTPGVDPMERTTNWARLAAWVELPASLFARGELEVTNGDDAEGRRLRLGLGYRF